MRKLFIIIILCILYFFCSNFASALTCTKAVCDGETCVQESFDGGFDESCLDQLAACRIALNECLLWKEANNCDVLPVTNVNCLRSCGSCQNDSVCQIACSNTWCTCSTCGPCSPSTTEPTTPCIPNCTNKTCGADNGCGGPCGSVDDPGCGATKTCRWTTCDTNIKTCSLNHSKVVSVDDDCPDGCSSNTECNVNSSTGKCGLDSENYLVCKLDGTGTGKACSSDAECTCSSCPVGQVNPHGVCSSNTCVSTPGCGINECVDFGDCSNTSCSIDSFTILPLNRTILLGSSFKANWGTTNCDYCNLSCSTVPSGGSTTSCGRNLPASGLSANTDYSITPTKSGAYDYTLECFNDTTSSRRTLGTGVGDDGTFKVRNFFWRETPAFLKLLFQKIF